MQDNLALSAAMDTEYLPSGRKTVCAFPKTDFSLVQRQISLSDRLWHGQTLHIKGKTRILRFIIPGVGEAPVPFIVGLDATLGSMRWHPVCGHLANEGIGNRSSDLYFDSLSEL